MNISNLPLKVAAIIIISTIVFSIWQQVMLCVLNNCEFAHLNWITNFPAMLILFIFSMWIMRI
jgi:hypothetical protein